MSWWVIAYFLGYGGFTVWWLKDDLRNHKSVWSVFTELLSDGCMVIAALGFWFAPVREFLGNITMPIFVAGLAWFVVAGVREFKEHYPDGELPLFFNIAAILSSLLFLVLVSGPLLYWGFQYAVLGLHNGT